MEVPTPIQAVGPAKPKPRGVLIDVRRCRAELAEIAKSSDSYSSTDTEMELAEIATDLVRDVDRGCRGAARTGMELVRLWRKHQSVKRRWLAEQAGTYYGYAEQVTVRPAPRTRGQKHVRQSLPRTRCREQSHAPRSSARSTPKTASRSGDSGDSSDPPGPSDAAVAAFFLLCLLSVWGWGS